jgi:hypothetical protein
MIREVCSCGAEFESDLPNQVELVKNWRRTHTHSDKPLKADSRDSSALSNTDIALGFQAIYDPLDDDI